MELLKIAIAEIRSKAILWLLQQGISVTESTTLRAFEQEMLTLKFHHSALPPNSVAVRLPPLQHARTHTQRVNWCKKLQTYKLKFQWWLYYLRSTPSLWRNTCVILGAHLIPIGRNGATSVKQRCGNSAAAASWRSSLPKRYSNLEAKLVEGRIPESATI